MNMPGLPLSLAAIGSLARIAAVVAALAPTVGAGEGEPAAPAAAGKPVAASEPARFVLPEGFSIEAVAGPPLVRYPLFACFDDAGRLYVAEGTGQSVPGTELVKQPLGSITRLEDTDGDGRFDRRMVFADGFVFPQGVLWHDGAVYVASHPAIWRLEDTDGDGRADRRQELVGKFNFNGNGCDIHGPFAGPDGRLYWTDGRHGFRIPRPDGTVLEGLASRIWRCRPDGSELEWLCGGGFDNPVEVAWTAEGELLGTMDQGAGDCLLHYVEGGVYPEEHPCLREFVRTGPLLGVAKRYSVELPAALCGTMRYRSTVFGSEFQDELLTTHYMTHKVVRSRLIRDGATFRAEDTDFLVSADPHLRLTDVLEDADGSLLVVDMGAWFTYGFLGKVLPRPEKLGSIYRIRRVDAPPVRDPRGTALRLAERMPSELVKLLDDPRPVVRDRVIERLAAWGKAAVPELERLLGAAAESAEARTNAIWALCRIDGPEARAAVRAALKTASQTLAPRSAVPAHGAEREPSPPGRTEITVAMAAVHAAGLHRDSDATDQLVVLLSGDSPPLRRKAAESLARIRNPTAVPALLAAARRGGDAFLDHALIYALIQTNNRTHVVSALSDPDPRVQRAALIALDQMPDGRLTRELVAPLLDATDPRLQQAALHAVSRRPEWAAAAHGLARSWLSRSRLSAEQQQVLADLVLAGSGDAELQRLAGDALANPATPLETRMLLLGVLRQIRLDPLPAAWGEGVERALSGSDRALQWETMAVVRTRGWRQFDEVLRVNSRDSRLPAEVRVAALECLAGTRQPLEGTAFEFLVSQLSESSAVLVRLAAARTLAASPLDDDQLQRLAGRMSSVSTMALRLMLPVFTRSNRGEVQESLVNALQDSSAAEALTAAELDALLQGYPQALRQRAAPLRDKLLARQRDQAAYLARLTAELASHRGDPDAGKEVFMAAKNNCFACHRAVGRGGTIGPDLSRIGAFRTPAELLESILFPSLSVAPQYQTHTVATRDGRVVTGLIVREAADALFLRTADLAEHRISRSDVQELVPSPLSIMPDGLEKTLTPSQLADLLEFLHQQR